MPCAGDLGKYVQEGSDIANFQLVCKAWKDASTTFTGPIVIDGGGVKDSSKLLQVSQSLPGLCNLAFEASFTEYQFKDHSFTGLASLSLTHKYRNRNMSDMLDLASLPASLKSLRLVFVRLDPQCFESLKCVGLTSIELMAPANSTTEIHGLLQYLPELEVSLSCSLLALFWMRIQSRS